MNQVKQVLGILGLIAALAGIALQSRWMIWVAIGLLGASIVLRLIISKSTPKDPDTP
jgi:hypothetical protein